ncbi:MAG TPA: hypothetical protein VF615_14710 [Longimicrobiaceae bacterium]|jgi:hypothetical protein
MTRTILLAAALLAALPAAPAAAQLLSAEPFAAYGFYGSLPETRARLEGGWGVGARATLRFAPRLAVFGTAQRSRPELLGQLPFGTVGSGDKLTVDHWSAGLEYSRYGSQAGPGALPLALSLGAGQVRYEDGPTDLAGILGASAGVRLGPNFSLRYGVTDYVSRYDGGDEWVNQVFARVGGEFSI